MEDNLWGGQGWNSALEPQEEGCSGTGMFPCFWAGKLKDCEISISVKLLLNSQRLQKLPSSFVAKKNTGLLKIL
jgi:hypothetical protein